MMVFRAERYPSDWKQIRARILARAGNVCETCRAPNRETIERGIGSDSGTYRLPADGEVRSEATGEARGRARPYEYAGRFVRVILTIAHVDHDESNNADENLLCLCQLHHLALDREDNQRRRRANVEAARAVGKLF